MKKLFLFLSLGIFFTVVSCDKSATTEDLQVPVEQSESIIVSEDQKTIPIPPGATTIDVQLPDGRIIQMDIPLGLQLKEDGTPKADRPASSRAGACNNVITMYPSANAGTVANLKPNTSIGHYSGDSRTAPLNHSSSSQSIALGQYGNVGYTFKAKDASFTNSIYLIIGSWECSGGKFDFRNLSFQGDLTNTSNLGYIDLCNQKCKYVDVP